MAGAKQVQRQLQPQVNVQDNMVMLGIADRGIGASSERPVTRHQQLKQISSSGICPSTADTLH